VWVAARLWRPDQDAEGGDRQHSAGPRIAELRLEHPFRVVKQQFGYAKARYRGLAKNTARLTMLFALRNLWMARRQVLGAQG
jgi:IS5 family transposase